jgi:hypothetical protein
MRAGSQSGASALIVIEGVCSNNEWVLIMRWCDTADEVMTSWDNVISSHSTQCNSCIIVLGLFSVMVHVPLGWNYAFILCGHCQQLRLCIECCLPRHNSCFIVEL